MTGDDTARLRTLAEAATPGPWRMDKERYAYSVFGPDLATLVDTLGRNRNANVAYIAAAHPQAVLALLDREDRQSALCTAMATHLDNLQHWTTLPDDAVILESRSTDGRGELKITAGMIRRANG